MLTSILLAAAFHALVSGQGRPIVFVPGLASSGEVWEATAARLRPQYQTHILTLAGFAGQPPIGEPLIPAARKELIAYLRKLKSPILVGHSLGATLALEVAAEAPEAVAAVVAVDGLPFLPALFNPAATEESGKAQAARIPPPTADSYARTAATMVKSPADRARVVAWGEKSSPKVVIEAMTDLMSHDRRPLMAKVKAPVLLVAAAGFAQTDAQREAVRARYEEQIKDIPRHEVVLAPEALHFVMLDSPGFLLDRMQAFMKEQR